MRNQLLSLLVLISSVAFSQTPAPKPAFEIADVRVSPRKNWSQIPTNQMDGGTLGGDRYELRRASMLDLIRNAYSIDAEKIFGGPSWLEYDRYDIVAKAKPGTKPAVLKQMLQTLLADRFHLVLKQETQPVQGFVLSVAKGEPKMKRSEGEGAEGCQQGRPTFGDTPPPIANVQCRNISIAAFADWLHGPARQPVLDSTGLDGAWDFELHYPMAAAGTEPAVLNSLAGIGLKVEPGKVPQPVLTVVSVDEQPTPNPAGTTEALPPRPPAEFDVASVRPCNDNFTGALRFDTGERLSATCMPVIGLIKQAFGMPYMQDPEGAPKSFQGRTDYSNVTIIAKAAAGTLHDRDTMNAMLRTLMIQRYKMVFHYEDRPMDTATLVAVKPKLTKADPAGRTGCVRQFPERTPGGFSTPTHLVCHNMTMAQFAEQIPVYDSDLFYPVQDQTSLEGAWDFTIDFDPMASRGMQVLRSQIRSPAASASTATGEAPTPEGGASLEDAIQRLGLKLEKSKHPQPVFVIDHMEEKPSEN